MAVLVNKSEFDALCSKVIGALNADSANAVGTASTIRMFTSGIASNALRGTMWTTYAEKYSNYAAIMDKRKNAADEFSGAVSSAQAQIDAAWYPDFGNELEDTRLAEVAEEIRRLRLYIAALEAMNEDGTLDGAIADAKALLEKAENLYNAIVVFLGVYQTV